MKFNVQSTSGTLWGMTNEAKVITLIGAGGKTTCLYRLAEEVTSQSLNTVLTTTTKVYPSTTLTKWCNPQEAPPQDTGNPCFWLAGIDEGEGKWLGPTRVSVEGAIEHEKDSGFGRVWLVEGDGARGRMVKCWALHEPQIPLNSECTVLVLQGGLWGKILSPEQVHRAELCPEIMDKLWNIDTFWYYIMQSPVFNPRYHQVSWVVFCNEFTNQSNITGNPLQRGEILLMELVQGWKNRTENKTKSTTGEYTPLHLRLAVGNAREGKIQWCDLW